MWILLLLRKLAADLRQSNSPYYHQEYVHVCGGQGGVVVESSICRPS